MLTVKERKEYLLTTAAVFLQELFSMAFWDGRVNPP